MNIPISKVSYLGVVSHPDHSEYRFRIVNDDKSIRLLKLKIDKSAFLNKKLMIQEAPDLCYQKVTADLKTNPNPTAQDAVQVTDADIEVYRESHPIMQSRRQMLRKPVWKRDLADAQEKRDIG
jgi:hypothetical protein